MKRSPSPPKPSQRRAWIKPDATWRQMFSHEILHFDGLSLAYQKRRKHQYLEQARQWLISEREERSNDICIVVGNGPSLNDVDFDLLQSLPVIASNYAYEHRYLRNKISYLTVTNPWVVAQAQDDFNQWPGTLLFPYYLGYWLDTTPRHIPMNFHFGYQPAEAIGEPVSTRSTVSYFNLQLAMLLGYKNIVMIGFDHTYQQPQEVSEGDLVKPTGHDANHFSDGYFADKYWQAADTNKMAFVYSLAAVQAQKLKTNIRNASSISRLEVFERCTLQHALTSSPDTLSDSSRYQMPDKQPLMFRLNAMLNGASLLEKSCFLLFSIAFALAFFLPSLPTLLIVLGFGGVGIVGMGLTIGMVKQRRANEAKVDQLLDQLAQPRVDGHPDSAGGSSH